MEFYQIVGLVFAVVAVISAGVLGWEWKTTNSLSVEKLPLSNKLILLSRLMIGGLFIYSGFVKANDYIGFGYKLEEYFMTFAKDWEWSAWFWNVWEPIAPELAWFISVFEIALGVAVMVGFMMNLTTWLSLLMMGFFTILTAYSAVTGAVTDCGCFGDALKIEPFESFIKDVILTVMLLPLFFVRKSIRPVPSGKIAGALTAGAFLLSGIYGYWCHEHLPAVDYRAYKVGVNLAYCTETIPPGEDFPKCKDWGPGFMGDYEPDFFSGTKMMVVAYDLDKADAEGMSALQSLAKRYERTGAEPVLLTASLTDAATQAAETYGLELLIGFMDGTALKTIVRSNPGYVLLDEGVIKGKWHHHDAPDSDEVRTALDQ